MEYFVREATSNNSSTQLKCELMEDLTELRKDISHSKIVLERIDQTLNKLNTIEK